jgi:hypothetical protein
MSQQVEGRDILQVVQHTLTLKNWVLYIAMMQQRMCVFEGETEIQRN